MVPSPKPTGEAIDIRARRYEVGLVSKSMAAMDSEAGSRVGSRGLGVLRKGRRLGKSGHVKGTEQP